MSFVSGAGQVGISLSVTLSARGCCPRAKGSGFPWRS